MAFPKYTNTFHTEPYPSISPTLPSLSTAGKVVLITGGGSGAGPHIVHAFARSGTTQIAILGRTESSLLATKAEVESQHPGVKVLTFIADIVDRAAVFAALEGAKTALGPIDILVSNAAYLPNPEGIAGADVDEWFKGFEVNVKGSLNLAQAFLATASSRQPTFVSVNTAAAHLPPISVGMSAYAVSKFALVKLMDYFAAENPHVRVMQVHPGVIETPMNKKAADAGFELPFDDVEMAAGFLVWAASEEAEFLKGKFIWANWDVDELKAKKEKLVGSQDLTMGLLGWLM